MRSKFATAILLTCVVAGCANKYGRDFQASDVQKIEKGTTTKADIRAIFGTPQFTTQTERGETWTYQRADNGYTTPIGVFGMKGTKNLSITFESDVVKDYHWSEVTPDKTTGTWGF